MIISPRSNRVCSPIIPCLIVWVMNCVSTAAQEESSTVNPSENEGSTSRPLVKVLPAVRKIPANFLKFYLMFPEPMERGAAFEHLALYQKEGGNGEEKAVLEPFREVELWDETGTRMTLWLHPGRQKTGVNLNVEFGPILTEGRSCCLEISGEWPTEKGKALGKASRHWFEVGEKDEAQPRPQNWEVQASRRQLTVRPFWSRKPEMIDAFDPFSLRKRVTIKLPDDEVITPAFVIMPDQFTLKLPGEAPFPAGKYQLIIDPKLEDLAGNSVARPFNLDVEKHPDFKESTEQIVVEFAVE